MVGIGTGGCRGTFQQGSHGDSCNRLYLCGDRTPHGVRRTVSVSHGSSEVKREANLNAETARIRGGFAYESRDKNPKHGKYINHKAPLSGCLWISEETVIRYYFFTSSPAFGGSEAFGGSNII